jgi:hypothetical protein
MKKSAISATLLAAAALLFGCIQAPNAAQQESVSVDAEAPPRALIQENTDLQNILQILEQNGYNIHKDRSGTGYYYFRNGDGFIDIIVGTDSDTRYYAPHAGTATSLLSVYPDTINPEEIRLLNQVRGMISDYNIEQDRIVRLGQGSSILPPDFWDPSQ